VALLQCHGKPGGYKYTDAASGATEIYDANGKLSTLSPIGGGQLNFEHSTSATPSGIAPAAGYLIGVQDHFGRTLSFTYALPTGGPNLPALYRKSGP